MKTLTCAAARRRLDAFHDGELSIGEQVAMAAHLDRCAACAGIAADIRLVGAGLRSMVSATPVLSQDELAGFHAGVVNRAKAERDASFVARVRMMFDDMHLVYAGLGATAATMVCVIIMLSMMRFASHERSDSLAAMVAFLATPGSSASTVVIDSQSHARYSARFTAAAEVAEEETVFTLADMLTHGGREARLERKAGGRKAGSEEDKLIEGLLDEVSRARFETIQPQLLRGANSMVFLMDRTTVRASQNVIGVDLSLPTVPAKKRAAFLSGRRSTSVA